MSLHSPAWLTLPGLAAPPPCARHVFQGVHMLLDFSSSAKGAGRPWAKGEKRVNRLVFIGKNLDREELNSSFRSCLVASRWVRPQQAGCE
jgi:G3E family GTPase